MIVMWCRNVCNRYIRCMSVFGGHAELHLHWTAIQDVNHVSYYKLIL